MTDQLWQWVYEIKGLFPEQVKLKRRIWLKKGEIFLTKKGEKLYAYILEKHAYRPVRNIPIERHINRDRIIESYLRFFCLASKKAAIPESKGGNEIQSLNDIGNKRIFSTLSISTRIPDETIHYIEQNAHKVINTITKLYDKYNTIVTENKFIEIALDYYYDAQKKLAYSNEGFISAVISMEALFNESPSDIKYKLSHRAAFLLGFCGFDSIDTFRRLKQIYNTRSNLVHGRTASPNDPNRHYILEYTRLSIIIFIILLNNEKRKSVKKNERKKQVLEEIDYAMLNPEMQNLLKREIKKGIKEFKLPISNNFFYGVK